jgi:hypothetical protein
MEAKYGVSMPTVEVVGFAKIVEGAPPVVRTLRNTDHTTRSRRVLRCGHEAPAGTRYTEWVGLVDGGFTTMVDCAFCRGEQYGFGDRYSLLREL